MHNKQPVVVLGDIFLYLYWKPYNHLQTYVSFVAMIEKFKHIRKFVIYFSKITFIITLPIYWKIVPVVPLLRNFLGENRLTFAFLLFLFWHAAQSTHFSFSICNRPTAPITNFMTCSLTERRKTNRRTSLFPLKDSKTFFRIVFMLKQTDFLVSFMKWKTTSSTTIRPRLAAHHNKIHIPKCTEL